MNQVIIIGAGIIGMLTAHLLSQKGVKVILIDQGYAGKESSWAGGGIISPLYPWRYNDAVTQLAKWSQQHYANLLEKIKQKTSIDPEFYQSGLLYLDIEDEQQQALQWANQYQYNIHHQNSLQLNQLEPELNSYFKQGWYSKETDQLHPLTFFAKKCDLIHVV